MEKYVFIREIGSGSFGKIFLVKSKQKGINYVVKQVDLNKLDRNQGRSASKEVEVLAKLRHNNIVSYKESYEKNNQLNIVLEYCENGDLHNKIKEKRLSNKPFGENEILDYFVQICLALDYIHSQKILHRDLKTKNIFLTKGNIIKIGDFGISKVLENSFELAQTCIGSPFYISPEICENKPYNKKSDVWALGCVLYELATLKYAFVAKNVKSLLTKILTGVYNPLPTSLNIHIRNLISAMLKPNPADRPSVREILDRRFLLKRRATFICRSHGSGLYKRRSKSGDVCRTLPLEVNNSQGKMSESKRGKISLSCLHLNQLKDQRKFYDVGNPKSIYKPLNSSQDVKYERKPLSTTQEKREIDMVNVFRKQNREKQEEAKSLFPKDTNIKSDTENKVKNQKFNTKNMKNLKASKVDSEYYDLIVGNDSKKSLESKEFPSKPTSQSDCDLKLIIYQKPNTIIKMNKADESLEKCDEQIGGLSLCLTATSKDEIPNELKNDQRKRWIINTLQRKDLLAILSDADLLDSTSSTLTPLLNDLPDKPKASVDDLLTFDSLEVSDDVLLPIKLNDSDDQNNITRNDYLEILGREVENLKERFELNNKSYKMEDLMMLTNNANKILKLETSKNDTESKNESWSYDLECQKMVLERKVGFTKFVKTYENMINMINDGPDSESKDFLPFEIDGSKTYVLSKVSLAGRQTIWNKRCEEEGQICEPLILAEAFLMLTYLLVDIWWKQGQNEWSQIDFRTRREEEGISRCDAILKLISLQSDSDEVIKNVWESIISILGDKQEYLPDIWELAMSESICYHS